MNSHTLLKPDIGAWVSIVAYLLLSLIKLSVSYFSGSEALKADGLNNLTDIIASIAILIGLKISRKPRDHDHPYGHSRAETIASLLSAFIMMSIGIEVLINVIFTFWEEEQNVPDIIAAWTALFSAIVMMGVSKFNNILAKKTDSQALHAISKDNFSDALVSIGAVIGITGSQFHLPMLDPIAASIVGGIICYTAWSIFKETSHMLTDGFDESKLFQYKKTIEEINGVVAVHDVKARMHGPEIFIDVTIKVRPELNVIKSHEIADLVEEKLKRKFQIKYTHVHIEPDLK